MENCSETKTTSTDIRARIDAERNRLLMEQNLEAQLDGDRLAPLEAGDDAALDRIEAQIAASLDRQSRIRERIEILERRLVEAEEAERGAELDALAAKAERARKLGEKLIKNDIAATLKKLAPQLERLAAYEAVVDAANHQLRSADREQVPSANSFRCRPWRDYTEKVTRLVGIGEPEHPWYREPYVSSLHAHGDTLTHSRTGEQMPTYVDIETEERRTDRGDSPDALHLLVVPGIGPAHEGSLHALWPGKGGTVTEKVRAEVVAEIDKTTKPNAAKRLLTALVSN